MSNSPIQTSSSPSAARQRVYALGAVAGLLFGLLSAHMFNRAASENTVTPGTAEVKTGELLGLGLAALAMIRQITEMGRPDMKEKRR